MTSVVEQPHSLTAPEPNVDNLLIAFAKNDRIGPTWPAQCGCSVCPPPTAKADVSRITSLRAAIQPRTGPAGCGQLRAPRIFFSSVVPMSGGSALRILGTAQVDFDRALLDEWVIWQRARNVSDKTIRERVLVIRRLTNAVTITAVELDRFLVNPAWSKATRATYHGAIRAWCLWLVRTKRREDDPTLIATPPRVPKRRPRPIANERLAVLLSTRMHRRTRAMILLGAYAGLRVSEIANIRGEDVDLITLSISVTGKGDKRRDVPLHPLLQTLAAGMPPRQWWFSIWVGNARYPAGGPMLGSSVSAVISKTMDRAGIPGTPHALRHWFGTALRAEGADSLVIKELTGHESLATTAIYVNVPLTQRTNAVGLLPDLSTVCQAVKSGNSR